MHHHREFKDIRLHRCQSEPCNVRPFNEMLVGRFCNELCLLSDEYIDKLIAFEKKISEVIAR